MENGIVTGNRTFYFYTTLFALGIFSAQLTPDTVVPAWLTFAAGACLAPCWRLPALRPCACFAIGALWALFRADLVLGTEWPSALESRDVVVYGTVADLPETGERYMKFDLNVERARFEGESVTFQGRVRLRWYDAPRSVRAVLEAGTMWRLKVRLKQPHGHYNPGGFDYEAYLFRRHIRATGYVRESVTNARLGEAAWPVLPSVRQALRDRLASSMSGLRHPGLLTALALGDRSGVTDDDWRMLRATGTNHLIAISGLHIGFVAAIGTLLGLWLGRVLVICRPEVCAPRVAAWSGLCFALAYAVLSGFAVPAQRAFVMAAVFLLGVLFRRRAWTVRGLCVALISVLLWDPASVRAPGFWLSFCAVALIVAWALREKGGTPSRDSEDVPGVPVSALRRTAARVRRKSLAAVRLQWMLSLAMLPLVLAFFGEGSLVAAPANTFAVPVVVFALVPLCLAAVASTLLGGQAVAGWCLGVADAVMHQLWMALHWLGALQWARIEAQPALWQSLVLLAGVGWLILARRRKRWWGLACGLVLFYPSPGAPLPGAYKVTVLDVGQGLSAVVRTANHTLVYDTGARYPGGFSLAKAVVIPYLRARGITDLDMVMISHGDNDHRGGFEDLVAQYPPDSVLSSVAGELAGAAYCIRGQRWQWDGVVFEVLHPRRAGVPPHNNASCVLRISGRSGSMLLTGDIESKAEEVLVEGEGAHLHSDVLLVPHQGSETSSTPSFLDAVAPRWAVVSAGYLNRYGHPRPAVVARYRKRGIRFRNTARAGAVVVDVTRNGIHVAAWREEKPRYWLNR